MIRYFKATDGTITVFRASPTRVYLSGCRDELGYVTFSGKVMGGYWPATEIALPEYKKLVAAKAARAPGATAPRHSWVLNTSL